jgi:hypothetical protein
VYEVEFCDDRGRAYALASLHAEQLLVLHNQGKEGVMFFREPLNYYEIAGLVMAIASLILLIRFA